MLYPNKNMQIILKNDHLWLFFNIIYIFLGSIFEPSYIQNCYYKPCYIEVVVYFRGIFLFDQENVCFVFSSELPHRGNYNEYTHHHFIEDQKDTPKLSPFVSWPGTMINPLWLKLPMSRTNFHVSKDIWAIAFWLWVNTWGNLPVH